MYENHRELWDIFKDDVSFPHQYNGAGILIHKDAVMERFRKALDEFERLIKEKEAEVARTAFS